MSMYGKPRLIVDCSKQPSLTRQSEKDNCDINLIVKRYAETGIMPSNLTPGMYADVSQIGDYRTALHTVMEADRMFQQLPAHIRAAFDNDAATFLDAFNDETNRPRLEELGLLPKTETTVDETTPPASTEAKTKT